MRLLITGGAGCLGSNLIERYLPLGHEICVIDNFVTGKKETIPQQSGLTVHEGSIADHDLVEHCVSTFKPTCVINSAASYKDPNDWIEDANTNIIGAINITKSCEKAGVRQIINFQTALCFGRPEETPIKSNARTQPFTSYGISKTAGESILLNTEVPTISLRLANICAPRLAIGPIPTFYKRLKEGKSCFCSDSERDFLDIKDFFSLMDVLIEKQDHTGTYNVSTGIGTSIHDIFASVCKYLSIEKPEVPIMEVGEDDVKSVVLDPSLTKKTFDWEAKITLDEIVSNQLKWYDEYGVNDVYSHLQKPV